MYLSKACHICSKDSRMIDFLPEFHNDPESYLFIAFAAFALIQLLYVVLIYGRLAFYNPSKAITEFSGPVTIIIAARNESENLYRNLPSIMDQDYPEFEVIIINHQSVDDSQYILDAYKQQYPNLRTIEVMKNEHMQYGKKLPLTIGIKGAKHEHLLFTDADCTPASKDWLRSMTNQFNEKNQIILGYGPYKKLKGLLNRFIRFDTAWIAVNYFSMARARMPYMGIGRNMAYTKAVFESVRGFKSHYSISSGDDDLFIQEAAKNKNYVINVDPASFCYSVPAKTWKDWINQKSRHYTTSERYKVFKKLMLGIYPLSLLLMLVSFVILLFDANFVWLSLAVFVLILLVKWVVLGLAFKRIREVSFIGWLPLLDIVYAIWSPILYYTVDRTDNKKW